MREHPDEYATMLTNLRALNLSEESHAALNTSLYLNAQLSTLTERVVLLVKKIDGTTRNE